LRHCKRLLFGFLLGAAAVQASACYIVYDRASRVLYNGESAPVDMSLPLHEALSASFPAGAHMVFDTASACAAVVAGPARAPALAGTGTPLLTDRRTAQAMHVPFTPLEGGIALVQPGALRMRPGVTVVPAETFAANTQRGTVITELREPPVGITQQGDRVAIGERSRY
jgi:hypothetical protein